MSSPAVTPNPAGVSARVSCGGPPSGGKTPEPRLATEPPAFARRRRW